MLGRQHALAGATAWLAAYPAVDAVTHLTGHQVALGTALAAGGALVPDWDMPGTLIARTYGPVTNVIAHVIAFLARGHRRGTHCYVGLAVMVAAFTLLAAAGGFLAAVTVWLLLGVAARAVRMSDADGPGRRRFGPLAFRHLVGAGMNAAVMAAVTGVVFWSGVDVAGVLPWAASIGAASHIATDCLTDKGCPLMFPLTNRRYGWALFTTGGKSTGALTFGLTVLFVGSVYVTLLWQAA